MKKDKHYRKMCISYIIGCILILVICIVICFTIIKNYQSSNKSQPPQEKNHLPQETIFDDRPPNDKTPYKGNF